MLGYEHTQSNESHPNQPAFLRISVMQSLDGWTTALKVRFDSKLSCFPDCYSVLGDFLIGYCFLQHKPRSDVGLVEASAVGPVGNKLFRPFHVMAFVDYPY